jgi:hypothetical protein
MLELRFLPADIGVRKEFSLPSFAGLGSWSDSFFDAHGVDLPLFLPFDNTLTHGCFHNRGSGELVSGS